PNGDMSYQLVGGDATLADDPEANPQMVALMKTSLGSMKGLTTTGTISARGFNQILDAKAAGADPQVRQMLDQMKQGLANISAPLPEEAVGPGAKWQIHAPVKSQGMTLDETMTYELVSIDGDRINTTMTVAQQAAPQKI